MDPAPYTPAPAPTRILIRGVNWLGDAIMTTPALRRLRELWPGTHFTILTPGKLAELWTNQPGIQEVLAFEEKETLLAMAERLREGRYDLALILPNSPRSALEAFVAGIPRRVGYARGLRRWLLTDAVPVRPEHVAMRKRKVAEIQRLVQINAKATHFPTSAHQVHEYLWLAGYLGASQVPIRPKLVVSTEEIEQARRFLAERLHAPVTRNTIFFGLNPAAEYGPAKRWPAERFARVARQVSAKHPEVTWIVFGGKADTRVCGEVASGIGPAACNLAGTTTLRQLMGLLKLCRLVLTNDTGPMHLASALDTPVVVPFGSTSPELTGPGLPGDSRHALLRSPTPCAPCFLRRCPIDFRCMEGISVTEVAKAVQRMGFAR